MSWAERTATRLAAGLLLLLLAGCGPEDPRTTATDPLSFLSGPGEAGFARADRPREFTFPADHAAHPDFRSEWWYFTGNLESNDGSRQFGFQVTFFRFALAPGSEPAGWATRQLWLGQLAISDLDREVFHDAERISRGVAGLAGAADGALDVRIEDWRITGDGALETVAISTPDREIGLALTLSAQRAPVLQGERGLSRKGKAPGNASYYYSVPRLTASGTIRLPTGTFPVTGQAWFDREWSTSALEDDQAGWDWFALQFEDGTDAMVYRLRDADGTMHEASAGVIVDPAGVARHFGASELTMAPTRYWTSPETGRRYPVDWRVTMGPLSAAVAARMDAQEHRGRFEYWEGAVSVTGEIDSRPAAGIGYLEMTGYD